MSDTDTKIADGLSRLLADAYAVYLKTHGYHWNVRGPNFASRSVSQPPPHRPKPKAIA